MDDRIPSVAGGITFFFLLALFPALASIVSLYGMFADRTSIANVVGTVAPFVPGGVVTVLHTELQRLIAQKPDKLNFAFLSSLVVALWSASGCAKALVDGLNVAYEVVETRSFLRLTANALLLTLAAIAFAIITANLAVVAPMALRHMALGTRIDMLLGVLLWPAAFVLGNLLLSTLYGIGPNRKRSDWQWISWGSAMGSVFWILGTIGFAWYAKNFGSYDRVYGSLGAIVGFLTWIWLCLLILLSGAELNSEIEKSRTKTAITTR
jgi:membrane protein